MDGQPLVPNGWGQLWHSNSATAIVLKDQGIVVAKMVNDGRYIPLYRNAPNRPRTRFASLAEWKASLPAGGVFEVEARDATSEGDKRKNHQYAATTDVEYVSEALKVWDVKQTVYQSPSVMQMLGTLRRRLEFRNSMFMSLTRTDGEDYGKMWRKCLNAIGRSAMDVAQMEKKAATFPERANVLGYSYIQRRGTTRLYAFKGGDKMGVSVKDGKIYFDSSSSSCQSGTSFAEMGLEMVNGKPRLEVFYRNKTIVL